MKKISYIAILLFISSAVWSQNMMDALRLSDYRLQGTARAAAMGNAFGALGGDFTSASINPAGIGLYRSNEFELSAAFGQSDIDGTYLNNKVSESKDHFSIPNMGYVAIFNTDPRRSSSLVSINVGVGYNRMNDFNIQKRASGDGATSSMLDLFAANADGYAPGDLDPYYEQLAAYDQNTGIGTDLIYNNEEGAPEGIYRHDMQKYPYTDDFTNYAHGQRRYFSQKGSIDEYLFSIAANFNHKFYIGATLGIQDVYFRETTSLYEYDSNNNIPDFNNYSFDTYLRTTGTGINAKLGFIYKPIDQLRLGVALHTPTYYDLTDNFQNAMYSSFTYADGSANYDTYSPYVDYDYDLRTPMKAVFSASYIIGKAGLISVDYEYVDYSNAELNDGEDGYDFYNENDDIEDFYKSVGNLHVGGEYRLSNNFSLRAGFEYFPSPYEDEVSGIKQPNGDSDTYTYSGGVGWKMNGFFVDLAYKHIDNKNYLNLYDVPETANPDTYTSPTAKFDNNRDYLTFTFGFRF